MIAWARIRRLLHKSRQRTNKMTIDCLPPEILGIIFLHVLPPFPFGKQDPEHTPKILSQVCRLWRALALALPALWASLNIKCSYDILNPQLHTIHTHLQRSAAYPLSIVFDTYDPRCDSAPPNPHFSAVLAALIAARDRWHCVSIRLTSEATRENLDAITQGDAPLLEVFCCEIGHMFPDSVLSVPLRALQGCPRLESLTWNCMPAPLSPALGDEAWMCLTTLHLDAALTVSDCLVLLHLSPRLSTAEFQKIDSPGVASSRHLLHATLHRLRAAGACVSMFIAALTLPALGDLSLNVCSAPHPAADGLILSALLTRSTPPLHTLSMNLPEAVLLHTLALAPDLHTLGVYVSSLDCVPFTTALVHALHPSSLPHAAPPLCPRLTTLRIYALEAPDGACTAMLRARWGVAARASGVACLKVAHIALAGNSDMHRRDYAEMKRLNKEGMVGTLHRDL